MDETVLARLGVDAASVVMVLLLALAAAALLWLSRAVAAKDRAIADERATVEALRAAVGEKEAALAQEYGRAERLEGARAEAERTIGGLRGEIAAQGEALRASEDQCVELRVRTERLQTEMRKDHAAAQREIATLRELREEMKRDFKALSAEIIRVQGEDITKTNHERLTALLEPFKQHVDHFQKELRTVHRSADEERARLKEQIEQLHKRSEVISQEALSLTRALKGDKQRQGAWGEMILERILEDSGLERDIHYRIQAHHRDEDGKAWRPDVVVQLPKDKTLVIDSKVSLNAYEAAVAAEDEAARKAHSAAHVAAVERHINLLADKGYHGLDGGSVDYVLMFVPIEGALSEALRVKGDLTSLALQKGVGIMTPTTLMVALRTVEHIWAVERRESNADEIASRAGKLYDKLCGFVSEMDKVGDCLRKAQEAHGTAFDRLSRGSGNVMGQVEKLKKLGARTNKSLPQAFDDGDDDVPALPAAEGLAARPTAAE